MQKKHERNAKTCNHQYTHFYIFQRSRGMGWREPLVESQKIPIESILNVEAVKSASPVECLEEVTRIVIVENVDGFADGSEFARTKV